jgi:hypothetical protein
MGLDGTRTGVSEIVEIPEIPEVPEVPETQELELEADNFEDCAKAEVSGEEVSADSEGVEDDFADCAKDDGKEPKSEIEQNLYENIVESTANNIETPELEINAQTDVISRNESDAKKMSEKTDEKFKQIGQLEYGSAEYKQALQEYNDLSRQKYELEGKLKELNDIDDSLDKMELSPEYKKVVLENFNEMDGDLRSEYSQHSDKLVCLDNNCEGTAYFSPEENGFKFNEDQDSENPLGAGNTFFHESGHMLDRLKGQAAGGEYISQEIDLGSIVKEDYNDAIGKISIEHNCDSEEASEILSDILLENDIESNCVSDVFGGVSGNKVSGAYGHSNDYWSERDIDAVGKEVFAEITADRACGNENSIAFTKKYLPKTYAAYENALKSGGKL